MREQRLLERIRRMEADPDRRVTGDPNVCLQSVLEHLTRILNTKQGSAEIDPDFGVPDFTDLPGSFSLESIPELERVIKKIITRYEPRLEDLSIRFVPQDDDVLSLRFTIAAKFAAGAGNTPIVFETVVDSDGKVNVRS